MDKELEKVLKKARRVANRVTPDDILDEIERKIYLAESSKAYDEGKIETLKFRISGLEADGQPLLQKDLDFLRLHLASWEKDRERTITLLSSWCNLLTNIYCLGSSRKAGE